MIAISWKPLALKQMRRIPQKDRDAIVSKVDELCNFPLVHNVITLKQYKYQYRLRVGRYRVLFNYKDIIKIISVEEVKKRDGNTY